MKVNMNQLYIYIYVCMCILYFMVILPPSPDNKTEVDIDTEKTSVQATKLSSALSIRAMFSGVGGLLQKSRKIINQVRFYLCMFCLFFIYESSRE